MKLIHQCSTGEIEQKTYVCFKLYKLGRDWLLTVLGGEEHIGAISISDKTAQSEHHISLLHHKEGDLVTSMLQELKNLTSTELLIVGGIHYEEISNAKIEKIILNCRTLTTEMKDFLEQLKS